MSFGEGVREFYRQQGERRAEKRIIKLLEEQVESIQLRISQAESKKDFISVAFWQEEIMSLESHIALIKGEK